MIRLRLEPTTDGDALVTITDTETGDGVMFRMDVMETMQVGREAISLARRMIAALEPSDVERCPRR